MIVDDLGVTKRFKLLMMIDDELMMMTDGFRTWRKVRGKKYAFLNHVGTNLDSAHKRAEKSCEDLMNQSQHIQHVFHKYITQDVADNQLWLKFLIRASWHLALQGSAFRGHDESESLDNHGNFLELLVVLVEDNETFADLISKTPRNVIYTSPKIQKEILHIYSMKVRKTIREEIGDEKFCIIVDEAHDKSKKEQMKIVFRFVDKDGIIYFALSNHTLDIQNIRGQGYDDPSNMRAHRLQLALVAASRMIIHVHQFFTKLTSVVNVVGASCKRNNEAGETRWGSHFKSVSNLINMFSATCEVLINIVKDGKMRDKEWQNLLENVIYICKARNIDIPDMNARYIARQGRARNQEDNFTIEQHYWVNIFYTTIDSQLQELDIRFNDSSVELLMLSSTLDFREGYDSFRIDNIYNEKIYLRVQLDHYNYNVVQDPKCKNLSSLSDLCQWLARTRSSSIYLLVYRIIVLVLTLLVSTATTERSFSTMRIVKTRLRNKMDDDFLTDTLITYIERDIAEKINMESVIDDFRDMKE
ncbi:hypothetical protein CISIN_1g046102mg, partial [Citrus sinensis]